MSTFTSPFTGTVVQPTDVSYYLLSFGTDQTLFWPQVVDPTQVPASRIMDCIATTTSLEVALPAADQGSLGTDILFRNLGSNAFVVTDATGGASVTIAVGQAVYFYLTDNTTTAGTWGNVAFGVGTSYADAATLAGAGLTTVSGQLATTQNIVDVSVSPTINDASRASTFVWNSGAGTFTLPPTATLSPGWYIGFRNNGTGVLALTPTSPATINGSITVTTTPGDSGFIFYDESNNRFVTVGWVAPANVTFTSATYDVDAIVGNTLDLVSYAPIIQTYIAQSGTRTVDLAVTLPPITQIYVLVNNTNQSGYNITFQVQGTSQSPISIPTGTILTALSDGTNLYSLTQTTTNTFQANSGNAGAPAYTFANDLHTGMYLAGTSILGLSANSTAMITLDNTNTLQPLLTTPARIVAGSIAGGQF
jgi:hypothetical protein